MFVVDTYKYRDNSSDGKNNCYLMIILFTRQVVGNLVVVINYYSSYNF